MAVEVVVAVRVAVGMLVGVRVGVAVKVMVGVSVSVGTAVSVSVGTGVSVRVGVMDTVSVLVVVRDGVGVLVRLETLRPSRLVPARDAEKITTLRAKMTVPTPSAISICERLFKCASRATTVAMYVSILPPAVACH